MQWCAGLSRQYLGGGCVLRLGLALFERVLGFKQKYNVHDDDEFAETVRRDLAVHGVFFSHKGNRLVEHVETCQRYRRGENKVHVLVLCEELQGVVVVACRRRECP